jgi:hypothetical protein
LGISENFGTVDFENLIFPAIMKVDYIRVYQPVNKINIGCDPKGFPTSAYIDEYIDGAFFFCSCAAHTHFPALAYMNPNLTTWVCVPHYVDVPYLFVDRSCAFRDDYKQPFPKNKLVEQC